MPPLYHTTHIFLQVMYVFLLSTLQPETYLFVLALSGHYCIEGLGVHTVPVILLPTAPRSPFLPLSACCPSSTHCDVQRSTCWNVPLS